MNAPLEALLRQPGIWRGDRLGATALPGLSTGHAALDALLPGGGWPRGALTELIVREEGIGEFSLLLPALAALSREARWIALVAPPHLPYAPALAAAGLALARLLVVRSATTADSLWAMEQALRSGACGAVLAWPAAVNERAQRRLQLAAEAGASWGLWFTPARQAASASMAALRLGLAPAPGGLEIRFLKRRGGGAVPPLVLDLSHAVARPALPRPGPAGLRANA
jgi:protein ImuA